jgi:hypothetical protein
MLADRARDLHELGVKTSVLHCPLTGLVFEIQRSSKGGTARAISIRLVDCEGYGWTFSKLEDTGKD